MTSFNHVRGDTFSVLHTLQQPNNQGRDLTGYQIAAVLEQRNGVVVATLDVQLLDQITLTGQFVLSVADSSTWPLTRLRYKVRFTDPMGNISTSGHIDVRVTTAHDADCCLAEDAVQVGVSPEIVIVESTPDQLTVSVGTVLVGGGGGINLPIEQSDVRELPTVLDSLTQADLAESQARQIAVGNLQQQIAGVTALAQTNQLNLGTKADQTDLNATNTQVELNRLAILSKADITALAMLTALVNTKADQSYVHDQIAALVGSDAQLLATIQAIADELANTEGLLEALDYTVANRVRFDIANQALTTLQKYNARTNIGAEELGTAQLLIAQITAATIGAATAAQGAKADTALQSADMAPVAFTGQFSSLAGQSGIFNVVFSAYTAGVNSVLTATDTLGTMLGKLQAQIVAMQGSVPSYLYNYSNKTARSVGITNGANLSAFGSNIVFASGYLQHNDVIEVEFWLKTAGATGGAVQMRLAANGSAYAPFWNFSQTGVTVRLSKVRMSILVDFSPSASSVLGILYVNNNGTTTGIVTDNQILISDLNPSQALSLDFNATVSSAMTAGSEFVILESHITVKRNN